ncbi:MAG: hypothetical protein EA396_02780 [Anaerolineaceae bacterium]|nr:MAG: hypothetical protein EA396_02780 [Anaerolineaceae bacterium]
MNAKLLLSVPDRVSEPGWLRENIQELYDTCRGYLRQGENLNDVVMAVLYIVPTTLDSEEVKRWGKLLEQVYLRTPYAMYNGLDAINTLDVSDIYVFQKRPKIPQLPTKTKRNKRVIVHPTQMLEMYLIMMLGYVSPEEIKSQQIADMLYFARMVGDSYLSNKTHTTVGYLYLRRGNPELALSHAEITTRYWKTRRLMLEDGLNAYVIGEAYRQMDDLNNASFWLNQAADYLSRTTYKNVHFTVELIAAALRLQIAREGVELDSAQEEIDMTLTFFSRAGNQSQARRALQHIQPIIDAGNGRLGTFADRLRDIAEQS